MRKLITELTRPDFYIYECGCESKGCDVIDSMGMWHSLPTTVERCGKPINVCPEHGGCQNYPSYRSDYFKDSYWYHQHCPECYKDDLRDWEAMADQDEHERQEKVLNDEALYWERVEMDLSR